MKTNHSFLIIFSFFIFTAYSQIDESNFNSDTIKNRLERLNAKTPIELYFTPSVEKTIKRYLNTRVEFYKKNIDKLNYYLPLFEEQLQNQKRPVEIKYLPIIESRLDPSAVSKVGATGLWQFMFYTALENGLTMNSYVDERMDPYKSTAAAALYPPELCRAICRGLVQQRAYDHSGLAGGRQFGRKELEAMLKNLDVLLAIRQYVSKFYQQG